MSTSLKQDICDIGTPGVHLTDVTTIRIQKSLPPEVQYACLYWASHLHKSGSRLFDNSHVHQFLQKHLLHWLEALSWMRKMREGILAINSLVSIALVSLRILTSPKITTNCFLRLVTVLSSASSRIQDVKRFAQYNLPVIEQAPLQVYLSALVFAPVRSLVRNRFKTKHFDG